MNETLATIIASEPDELVELGDVSEATHALDFGFYFDGSDVPPFIRRL